MKSNQEILDSFRKNLRLFLDVKEDWRRLEVMDNYGVYDGIAQWTKEDYDKQIADQMPVVTINKTAPIVDAVGGFQIQNRFEVTYQARRMDDDKEQEVDVVEAGAKYIEEDSKSPFENSQAFQDMTICGVGSVNHNIEYEEDNINGDPDVRRIFPYFVGFDPAARRKNLSDRNWCFEAKIISEESAIEEVGNDLSVADSGDAEFLQYFDDTIIEGKLSVAYDYQWREKEIIYRVKNTIRDTVQKIQSGELQVDSGIAEMLDRYVSRLSDRFNFDLQQDTFFVVPKKDRSEVKKEFESLGLEYDDFKQKRYKYYRAKIIGNTIVSANELFSQKGFTIKFMTGKFDERNQRHYGMVRAMVEPQRLLNQSVSDYQGFLRTIPKGGQDIEVDAVDDIKAFKDTINKAKELTVYAEGGLNKSRPKPSPPMPDGLLQMIDFALNSLMEVVGVTPSFMGEMDSKELTGKLQAQLVRSGLSVLAVYFDAFKFFMQDQAEVFIDMVKTIAENDNGRMVRNVTGKGKAKYIELLRADMAQEYDIVLGEMPQTPSEKQDTFEKLMELSGLLAQKGLDIVPLAIPFSPLKKDERDAIMEMLKPQPAPPEDPITREVLVAEIKEKLARASKDTADAKAKDINTLKLIKELATYEEELSTDIDKTKSDIIKNLADAGKGMTLEY